MNPFGNKVNFFCSKISQKDLKRIKLDLNESSAVALIPISCLRGYKTEAEITDCTYDKYHKVQLPKFKETNGFIASTNIIRVPTKDIIILQGEINVPTLTFRPQGYFELERTVLSRLDEPSFKVGRTVTKPCLNLEARKLTH